MGYHLGYFQMDRVIWFIKIWCFNQVRINANAFYLSNHGMTSLIIKHLWKFLTFFSASEYGILPSVKAKYCRFKSLGKAFWEIELDSQEWDISTSLLDSKVCLAFWGLFKGIWNFLIASSNDLFALLQLSIL